MILRISGLPKLNIFRKIFWKIVLKKISVITTPTISTQSFIKNKIKNKPIFLLRDPILNIGNIKKNKLNKNIMNNKFLAMGRLTKQKNFLFLLKCFQLIIKKNPKINLFILGEGEEFHRLKNFIKTNNLEKNIFLEGYKKNIYDYLLDSKAFILSSLWEDPGFVLIEAAYSNTTIISSDCNNGPKEILNNGKNGFIFNSNDKKNFLEVFNNFQLSSRQEIYEKKLNAKKMSRKFTLFNHYLEIQKILNSYEK
jgi:glycosyltransferase involved in cell wall biosynthesis